MNANTRSIAFASISVALSLVLLLWLAPAQWLGPLVSKLTETELECQRWSGTIWHGRCDQLRMDGGELGSFGWQARGVGVAPVSLKLDLGWRRADSWLQAELIATDLFSPEPQLQFFDVRGNMTFETLRSLLPRATRQSLGLLADADGRLWVKLAQLVVSFSSAPWSEGELLVEDLRVPGWPSRIGPLRLQLRGDGAAMTGTIQDMGGPLQVALRVDFEEPQILSVRGEILPRPIAADRWQPLLALVGPKTAAGGYGVDLSMEWQTAR